MQFCFQAKLAILEQKLLKEEHERQLVQEKADMVSPCKLHFLDQLFEVTEESTFLLFNSPYSNMHMFYNKCRKK